MEHLKKDEIRTIYADPLSEKRPEGKARLVNYVRDAGFYDGCTVEYWEVCFISDRYRCMRYIKCNSKVEIPDEIN